MRSGRTPFLSLVLLSAIGCASAPSAPLTDVNGPGTPIVVTEPWSSVTPTQMTLRFENPSTASYILTPDVRMLERLGQDGWQPVSESGRAASDLALELTPGQVLTSSTDIPSGLPAGTYRFRYSLAVALTGSDRLEITSNAFERP